MRSVHGIYGSPDTHWIGDGFPMRSLVSHASLSPFVLMDYAGPAEFRPSKSPRGVETHAHRGLETVSIVYQRELSHCDSSGGAGVIGTGDVQWTTAAAGILHEDFHSEDFTRTGGTLEMVQLWINLPARFKKAAPGHQTLAKTDIPVVALPDGGSTVRVIAGEHRGVVGPAQTFTPLDVWDLRLISGGSATLSLPEGHTLGLVVLHGDVLVNGRDEVRQVQLALMDRERGEVTIESVSEWMILLLSGEPIDEPVAIDGPFVMNSSGEIQEAMAD